MGFFFARIELCRHLIFVCKMCPKENTITERMLFNNSTLSWFRKLIFMVLVFWSLESLGLEHNTIFDPNHKVQDASKISDFEGSDNSGFKQIEIMFMIVTDLKHRTVRKKGFV